ncbi:MAG: MFS transporter [Chloroflexota bacterium]
MKLSRNFLYVTFADLLARSAYQTGKIPLLPIFAAALGATDAFLGIIVSVSTLTGMIFKPFIGMLSDRWGRRRWLIAGTAFFAIMPFFYQLVQTPNQLFWIRIIHGTATAIYGPVTLAYVTEQTGKRKAEGVGWFGMARSAGYIIGPAAAGYLLLTMDPADVFTIIGVVSIVAFLPILLLTEPETVAQRKRPPLLTQIKNAFKSGGRTPAVWLSGGLEAFAFIALYAVKTFLPIYALSVGFNTAIVGLFFALQEAVNMLLKPFGGRWGDRWGYRKAIAAGMMLLGVALPLLPEANMVITLLGVTILLGAAQAIIFPATVALVSAQIDAENLGAGMGIIGTMRNAGKVAGPILGGLLIAQFDFQMTFQLLGGLLIIGAFVIWLGRKRPLSTLNTSYSSSSLQSGD